MYFENWNFDEESCSGFITTTRNEDYKEAKGAIRLLIKTAIDCSEVASKERIDKQFFAQMKRFCISEEEIYDYIDEEKFVPHMFLNISPDWKGEGSVNDLDLLIDNYLKESQRFTEWTYIIENGSQGDHIHAHIVAKINPKYEKSTITHFNKGNHVQQLKKYANKIEGLKGRIKGTGINRTILRNPELIKDKLDYLIEDKKPNGHKNHSIVWDQPKFVSLFTVKD